MAGGGGIRAFVYCGAARRDTGAASDTIKLFWHRTLRLWHPVHASGYARPMPTMITLKEHLLDIRRRLDQAGIDDARLVAEMLAAHALGCERGDLLGRAGQSLDGASAERLEGLVARRLKHEPLEYITGWREFYGRRFICEPDALIPRPETEGIIDQCRKRLPADFAGPAIDLGTGAGSLAVTLALEFSRLTVVAADISLGALRVARKNAVKHGVSQRLPLLCGDWLSALAARPCFRLIVANPPYVDSGYAPIMHPEVRDFEPHVALFGGAGGLVQIRRLLPQVARRLMPQGLYMQEFAAGHGDEVLDLARQAGLTRCEVLPDFAGIERTLVASIN